MNGFSSVGHPAFSYNLFRNLKNVIFNGSRAVHRDYERVFAHILPAGPGMLENSGVLRPEIQA